MKKSLSPIPDTTHYRRSKSITFNMEPIFHIDPPPGRQPTGAHEDLFEPGLYSISEKVFSDMFEVLVSLAKKNPQYLIDVYEHAMDPAGKPIFEEHPELERFLSPMHMECGKPRIAWHLAKTAIVCTKFGDSGEVSLHNPMTDETVKIIPLDPKVFERGIKRTPCSLNPPQP